ncbi:MAG: exopolyphosphatase [Cyclobacteriaceae bacterium]|nr:exopolyphosphatase [Cyclobacteriaceae bacterium]MCB0499978.1 exopolyphosphatase [Cyclobacteriaceae bacterium]MCB9237204.1 exopolyphosphatase [Flammeovirgaceae bacterium]MCO5270913.1 exopolyphosphatase [Cyclobacteriaceae bacterium]MCW5901801.1 exopolyphosphatase [Cyclobacteriaceae bacterium]
MESRIAIVDLGTNTFHLLIVDLNGPSYRLVHRERQAVKLGERGINKGVITEEALQRALDTLNGFSVSIRKHQAKKVFAYGTSALRNARNQTAALDKIRDLTGMGVKLISGDEEARLIYLGVRSAVKLGQQKTLIVDIGGGSVEFIIGNESEIFWKQSIEIGAQRLLEEYHRHDPITTEDLEALHIHFEHNLTGLFAALQSHQPKTLVGSSGTFDTLSDIYCIEQGIARDPGAAETPLSFDGFKNIYQQLVAKDRAARMLMPGMIELRVDMIVVACSLIDYLIAHYPFEGIRVSGYALKEGVLSDIMKAHYSL